jgi:hypothetical protein
LTILAGGAPHPEIVMARFNKQSKVTLDSNGRACGILLSCDAYDNMVAKNQLARNIGHGIRIHPCTSHWRWYATWATAMAVCADHDGIG